MARKKSTRAKAAADEARAALDPATITSRKAAEAFVRSTGPFRCRGKIGDQARAEVNRLLAEGDLIRARQEDAMGRVACGADLTEIFATGPLDGEKHPYTCPRCGNTGTYRAASFPKLRAASAAA